MGRDNGLTEEKLKALADYENSEALSDQERTVLRYAESTWRRMRASGLRMMFLGAESGSDETLARMPELPRAKRGRFVEDHGLSDYEAKLLAATKETAARSTSNHLEGL